MWIFPTHSSRSAEFRPPHTDCLPLDVSEADDKAPPHRSDSPPFSHPGIPAGSNTKGSPGTMLQTVQSPGVQDPLPSAESLFHTISLRKQPKNTRSDPAERTCESMQKSCLLHRPAILSYSQVFCIFL